MPDGAERPVTYGKAARTRAHLRETAAELISRKSYLDTTMDEIAAAAGVSKGALYYHYSKKNEILFDIKCQALEELWEGLEECLAASPAPRDKLRRMIERQIRFYGDHLPQIRILTNDRHGLDPDQAAIVGDLEKRYFDRARELVATAIGSEDPARVNPIAFAMFGICNSIPAWFSPAGPATIEDMAENLARLFVEGLDAFLPG